MDDNIKMMIDKKIFIGQGAKRRVYDLGNGNILKVARSIDGVKSNKKEVKLYKSARLQVRKYMAKIRDYDHSYRWLIMKKYSVQFPKSKKYMQKYYKLKSKFIKNGIIPYDIYSMTNKGPSLTNLRLKSSGRIVVIDYGNFKYRR
jgi:hypothetical protein